jgi:D-aminopeptidase
MQSNILRTALACAGACLLLTAVGGQAPSAPGAAPGERPRARDLGVSPGVFPTGALNAITDVAGVRVGHVTVVEGDAVRTGVTAIVPHAGNIFQDKVAGAVFVGNAFGKLAGSTQVTELGTIETPIVLTNTLSVGTAMDAVVRYTLAQPGNERVQSVNAVVGETNDGGLNDIRGLHVTREHVLAAIAGASPGPVAEGSVGAGTGTQCYGWKGGIGTASRVLPPRYGGHTLGVLVQTNFGGVLTIGGAPVGLELKRYSFAPPRMGSGLDVQVLSSSAPVVRELEKPVDSRSDPAGGLAGDVASGSRSAPPSPDGSCLIVVATDAPIDARDLRRLAARAVFGLARTGSSYSNGSGDFAVAFSTAADLRTRFGESQPRQRTVLPPEGVSPLFQAALEATEEAVYNSLFRATSVTSRGQLVEAIPIERVKEILKKYGVAR